MAIILNIETATEICSVCISKEKQVIAADRSTQHYTHASEITLLIQSCLDKAALRIGQLDAVAVSAGPGSYTGLRIGVSTAKGLGYGLDIPLIAVDTLRTLALASIDGHHPEALYCPMIDARRMEVYTASYDSSNKVIAETYALVLEEGSFDAYFAAGKQLVFSGNGSEKAMDLYRGRPVIFSPVRCGAEHLVPLADQAYRQNQFADLAYFSPDYHKAPNITIPKKIL